jgi:hypothetical protein
MCPRVKTEFVHTMCAHKKNLLQSKTIYRVWTLMTEVDHNDRDYKKCAYLCAYLVVARMVID